MRWRPAGEATERSVELAAVAASDNVVVARLTGLAPGSRAGYRVEAGGLAREGTVRAQPWWSRAADAPPITLAIGSCFFLADADPRWGKSDYGGEYGIFDAIAAAQPDLMLWLGDNLYLQRPDFIDPASMAARYRRQRAFAPLQRLLTASAASRDLGRSRLRPERQRHVVRAEGRDAEALPALLAEPELRPARRPRHLRLRAYGDVLFFLLDDRYYRSPNRWPDGPTRRCSARASSSG